jgi:large subunit ribosomal protein L33
MMPVAPEFEAAVAPAMELEAPRSTFSVAAMVAAPVLALAAVAMWVKQQSRRMQYNDVDIEFGGEEWAMTGLAGEEDYSAMESTAAPSFMGGNFFSRMMNRMNPLGARSDMSLGARKKGIRLIVTLECTEARAQGETPSRYTTEKNKKNTSARLELMKYNKFLRKHTLHREIK